jgi:hypothetical protein
VFFLVEAWTQAAAIVSKLLNETSGVQNEPNVNAKLQTTQRTWHHVAHAGAERNRAGRARWGELDDAHFVTDLHVVIEGKVNLLPGEVDRSIDGRHRHNH